MEDPEEPAPTPEEPENADPLPPPPSEETPAPPPPEEPVEAEPAPEGEKPAAKKKEPKKPARKKPPFEMKLFEAYDLSEVTVSDPGLQKYINLSPIVLPHTGGRNAARPFGKMRTNVVERLINGMMRTEDFTGKKAKAYRVVRTAFEIIGERAKQNPVQVFVDALERTAPREEITRLRFGGISVPRAVDIAPSRRLDMALRAITQGAVSASFKNRRSIEECLANEILLAAKGDMNSAAISKKEELERVAGSAR